MKQLLFALALITPLALTPPAQAQDDDGGGFLTSMIEDALSSDQQQVRLFGFQGALSSRASFRLLTISDENGVWLTVEGAQLDWTRSALFGGRLVVNELSAELIDLERLPPSDPDAESGSLPSPTSTSVNLPSLPVSVEIGKIAAEKLRLGPTVLGEEVLASLDGSLSLDSGNGAADITAARIDGKEGRLALDAAFSNESRDLKIDLELVEAPEGVLANLLELPGRPAVDFSVRGEAPISDFNAAIVLNTDEVERLSGALRFMDLPENAGLGWGLDLSGDVSPLFQTAYQPFFGPQTELAIEGQNLSDGGLRLNRLDLSSSELDLQGSLELGTDGMPRKFDLSGAVHPTTGGAVLLPLSGEETRIGNATLKAAFDAAEDEGFSVQAEFGGFTRGDLIIQRGKLDTKGRILTGDVRQVLADMILDVSGLDLGDAALNEATGGRVSGSAQVDWTEGGALKLTQADITAGSGRLVGDVSLSGLEGNLRIETSSALTAEDLSSYAALAGIDLSGAASATVGGFYEPLGGAFDLTLDARTRALGLGEGLITEILGGDGQFTGRVARGPEGTRVDAVTLQTAQLSGTLSGAIAPQTGDLVLDLTLAEFQRLYPGLPGAASAKGTLGWQGEALTFDLTGNLPGEIAAKVAGTATMDGQNADVVLDAGLPNMAMLVPQLNGPFSARGGVKLSNGTASVDLATNGPEDAQLRLLGDYILASGIADMAVSGTADLAIANRFTGEAAVLAGQAVLDLVVKGPAEIASVGGSLTAEAASIRLPEAGISIPEVKLAVTLDPVHASLPQALAAARLEAQVPRIEAPGADWLALVDGPVDLKADLALLPGTQLAARNLELTNGSAKIAGRADLTLEGARLAEADLRFDLADLARLRPLVPLGLSGALGGDLGVTYDLDSAVLDASLKASAARLSLGDDPIFALIAPSADLSVTARLEGETLTLRDLNLVNGDASVAGSAQISPLASPGIVSDLRLNIGALSRLAGLTGLPLQGGAEAQVRSTYDVPSGDLSATIDGRLVNFSIGPGAAQDLLRGDATLAAEIALKDGKLRVDAGRFVNSALNISASMVDNRAELTATLDNLGRLVPELPGPVTVRGSVGMANGYDLDLNATGPGGINARVAGPISAAMVPHLSITGTAPLAVANPFLGTGVDVQGNVTLDLALRNSLDLAGLSGDVRIGGGRVAIAGASIALEDLGATVALSGGQAQIEATTGFNTSGSASLQGSVGLAGAMPLNLALSLRRVELVQQPTFRTVASGDLRLSGSLSAGGDLTGQINLEETEISLAFAGGGGNLIEVEHSGEPAASRATRTRAGLLGEAGSGSGGGGSSRLNLNVIVSAPNQVFVRGRGLDVELGGQLLLSGRAGNVVTSGGFDLIRGRLDILGRRLDVTEGQVRLLGDLDPEIRLVATTQAEGINVNITTQGTASGPNIALSSNPQLPEEEVLALLLFGRGLDKITPLQALQLANAVRTLLSGGEGIQGRLRQQFGLDELDVTTDSEGNVALRAGKYLSDNVYLNTEVGATGDVEIQLNLDITPNLTARGSAGSSGETSLGIFFERDY